MRYLLDTNILIFFFTDKEYLHRDIMRIIEDYDTRLYTSSVCVQEMIHLYQIGKLSHKKIRSANDILNYLHQAGITIVPINEKNLEIYANLPLYDGHTDPNDRLIIAQAISDKLPLISSDLKFALYTKNKLLFVRNKR